MSQDRSPATTQPAPATDVRHASSSGGPHPRRSRECFIPLRRARLVELLADDRHLSSNERDEFTRWCDKVMVVMHHEYHERLEAIKSDYDAFNPDVVTHGEVERTPQQRQAAATRLFANVIALLNSANYQQLSRAEIEAAADAASDWGVHLNVNFDVFERLDVYSRGDVVARRARRHWKTGYRLEVVDVPIYERLVVLSQLRDHQRVDSTIDTRAIYLKLFKNIPKQDVDMLLPCADFRMSWFDHGKVIVPTMSGFLLAVAKGFTAAIGALFTGFWGVLVFLGFVGGTAGYGVKSFLGYLRTKDKYQLNLTRNLYYQNLDNNAGVLFRVLDEAEEQECREVMLAYALLRQAAPAGSTEQQLDAAAEQFLQDRLGFAVDFDIADALQKLLRLGCASQTPDGRWQATTLQAADAALSALLQRTYL